MLFLSTTLGFTIVKWGKILKYTQKEHWSSQVSKSEAPSTLQDATIDHNDLNTENSTHDAIFTPTKHYSLRKKLRQT